MAKQRKRLLPKDPREVQRDQEMATAIRGVTQVTRGSIRTPGARTRTRSVFQ